MTNRLITPLMNCRNIEGGGGDGRSSEQIRSSRRLPAGSGDNRSAVMVNVRPSPSLTELPGSGEGGGSLYWGDAEGGPLSSAKVSTLQVSARIMPGGRGVARGEGEHRERASDADILNLCV